MNAVRNLVLKVVYHPHAARSAAVAVALFGLVFGPVMGPSAGGGGV